MGQHLRWWSKLLPVWV